MPYGDSLSVYLTDIFFASFPTNKKLCPMETLCQYMTVTSLVRKESDQLFVAIIKPHKSVAPCTIGRWLKEILKLSSVNVSMFNTWKQPILMHSTRSALVLAAADSGVTTSDILKAADWSTESVLKILLLAHTWPILWSGCTIFSN